MYFKSILLVTLTVLSFHFCTAQNDTVNAGALKCFPKSYGTSKWKPLISLDARRSYFAGNKVKINGLRLGLSYKGVHNFGFGFYKLNKNVIITNITNISPQQDNEDPEVRFNLQYSSIFYERVFIKTRFWEVDLPIHLGGGSISGYYKDTLHTFIRFTEQPFSTLIPSIQTKFYPLTWLALRASVGYRIIFNSKKEVKQTFRTAFLGYGISINPFELYRTVFKKENNKKINSDPSDEIR